MTFSQSQKSLFTQKTGWQLIFILLFKGENGIADLKAKVLRTIPKVESINLERNAVKSIHPQAFSGAKQLMLLNLYGNHITNLPSRAFKVKRLEREMPT